MFAGDGNTYNVNQPSIVGCAESGCSTGLHKLTVVLTTTIHLPELRRHYPILQRTYRLISIDCAARPIRATILATMRTASTTRYR